MKSVWEGIGLKGRRHGHGHCFLRGNQQLVPFIGIKKHSIISRGEVAFEPGRDEDKLAGIGRLPG